MFFDDEPIMVPWMNAPRRRGWYDMPGAVPAPYGRYGSPVTYGARSYPYLYPEIYHKLRPYIKNTCDELDEYEMPSDEMIEDRVARIHERALFAYPELEKYAREYETAVHQDEQEEDVVETGAFRGGCMGERRPGRKGLLSDLIRILFLSELFGRRGRRWRW